MTPEVERKVASILLALEDRNIKKPDPADIQRVMDHPDVAAWMTECRRKGFGAANIFTMGR